MELKLRIQGESPTLVNLAKESGLAAKLVKNAVIIDLQPKFQGFGKPQIYEIPVNILKGHKFSVLMELQETGGGATNTGHAQIVAALSGAALRPYFVPTRGSLSNGTHAHFSVSQACVTVEAYRHHGTQLTIRQHEVVIDGAVAQIKTTEIWSGTFEELPLTYKRYEAAAKAAKEKAADYHCRRAYYVQS
jgi:hypothetical protein